MHSAAWCIGGAIACESKLCHSMSGKESSQDPPCGRDWLNGCNLMRAKPGNKSVMPCISALNSKSVHSIISMDFKNQVNRFQVPIPYSLILRWQSINQDEQLRQSSEGIADPEFGIDMGPE